MQALKVSDKEHFEGVKWRNPAKFVDSTEE